MEGKSILWGFAFLAASIAMTGCAAVAPLTGLLGGAGPNTALEVHTETSVKLQEGNFVMVRTNLVGSSKGFRLLGFITLRSATLNKALNQLYASAEIEHGRPQTLAHLIVEHSGIYVILFSIPEVTVRADLVEFLPVEEQQEESGPENSGVQRISRPAVPGRWH